MRDFFVENWALYGMKILFKISFSKKFSKFRRWFHGKFSFWKHFFAINDDEYPILLALYRIFLPVLIGFLLCRHFKGRESTGNIKIIWSRYNIYHNINFGLWSNDFGSHALDKIKSGNVTAWYTYRQIAIQ